MPEALGSPHPAERSHCPLRQLFPAVCAFPLAAHLLPISPGCFYSCLLLSPLLLLCRSLTASLSSHSAPSLPLFPFCFDFRICFLPPLSFLSLLPDASQRCRKQRTSVVTTNPCLSANPNEFKLNEMKASTPSSRGSHFKGSTALVATTLDCTEHDRFHWAENPTGRQRPAGGPAFLSCPSHLFLLSTSSLRGTSPEVCSAPPPALLLLPVYLVAFCFLCIIM